ncbi:MAG: hypothetical protein IJJ25_09145 [Lachnospiraceae bacterium]|nr:hypothetical protein [Lachnospiraceae bacterium]
MESRRLIKAVSEKEMSDLTHDEKKNENKLTSDEMEKVNGAYIVPVNNHWAEPYKYEVVTDDTGESLGIFDTLEEEKAWVKDRRYYYDVSPNFLNQENLRYKRETGEWIYLTEKPDDEEPWF